MRRRITFAILGTVAAALLLAGLGTLALNRVTARNSAERDLRDQASASAALLETGTRRPGHRHARRASGCWPAPRTPCTSRTPTSCSSTARTCRCRAATRSPTGINLSPAQFAALGEGAVVSGSRGNEVYAAAPVDHPQTPNVAPVLFLTRSVAPAIGAGVGWFLLASAFTLLLGAVIAARLSRRLTKPLVEATQATARIADGDLAVRLPEHQRVARGSGDELDALAHSINEMADSLERSRGLERQFLLSVSHDLRTPLTSIRGYAEAIADGAAAPDDQAAAGVILAESRRLERLVRDLLDLAKLEGPPVLPRSRVRSSSATRWPRPPTGSGARWSTAGLRLELRRPDQPVWATADVDRLAQVLANLVENALKYAATTISVSVASDGGAARLEVADDGPGHRRPGPPPRVRAPLRRRPRAQAQGGGLGSRPGHRPRAGRGHGRLGAGRGQRRRRRPHGRLAPAAPSRPHRPAAGRSPPGSPPSRCAHESPAGPTDGCVRRAAHHRCRPGLPPARPHHPLVSAAPVLGGPICHSMLRPGQTSGRLRISALADDAVGAAERSRRRRLDGAVDERERDRRARARRDQAALVTVPTTLSPTTTSAPTAGSRVALDDQPTEMTGNVAAPRVDAGDELLAGVAALGEARPTRR